MGRKNEAVKIACENRMARHDYFIHEVMEAGIELQGTEVKSLRAGKANLKDSYAEIRNGEIFVQNMHISPYEQGNIFNHDPLRRRRLLLHKAEILCGDGTNEAFLRKCGIETTGAVAALTGIDEENVLIGMYIRKTWPKVKVITKVNRTSFQSIIDSMDLGSVFNPRNSASNLICRYVRTMQNSGSSSQGRLWHPTAAQAKAYASGAAAQRGWTSYDWTCLDKLWTRESRWLWYAENAKTGAYGIPQSLPASKMAEFGANYRDDGAVQIDWGLAYIARRYGSPSKAWERSEQIGWY